jgi:hypothetical protein
VDFLAGFIGIDLLGDDIDNKEKVEENLPL